MELKNFKHYKGTLFFAILTIFMATQNNSIGYAVIFILFGILTYFKERDIKDMGTRIVNYKNAITKKNT